MSEKVTEIRWHSRGGQGAKTAAGLVAEVAIATGNFGQGYPDYGAERAGAPMKAYTRISGEPIRVHSAIYHPDVVLVLDDTLLGTADVADGLREDGGVLLVNTTKEPEEIRKITGFGGKVYTIDATQIAIDEIGRPIPNMVMVGALVGVTGLMKKEDVIEDVKKKLGKKLPERVIQGNINAVERAIKEVKS
jgi:pyruvate ferredoxin oxidoreductase gamma subunit